MTLQELVSKRDALIKRRDEVTAGFNAEIEEMSRQMQRVSNEDGLRRCPKWAAASQAQRDHWAFMGVDPDDPDDLPLG